ncbi:unnamed protein product [Somion occarium]|uniref:Fatty acid desaturase domain-containing protein n=1 Tax=Somion occarium TaxID=3059160 RepID=A0ABP1D9C1_9APHY
MISGILIDSPEYEERKRTTFAPPKISFSEIQSAVPKHLFEKSSLKALSYVFRDVSFAYAFYRAALFIDPFVHELAVQQRFGFIACSLIRWSLWITYWWFEGVILAGWWCLAGHGTLSPYEWLNTVLGYSLHSFLLVPYFAWRSTHHAHHSKANSVEFDENYVPRTRTDFALPEESKARPLDYSEAFEEAPIYTLFRMLAMQLLGWQSYLLQNTLGSPRYPPGTNHFDPDSPLFRPTERNSIIMSNIGLAGMSTLLGLYIRQAGFSSFFRLYFIPYLLANHWIVMLTFLHHTDPTIPHYRNTQWSWLRGALATVDRPLLGFFGRFFLHNVSHDHIAHHLFPRIPFYNQPQVTEIVKNILKKDYNYDSTNTMRALYRSFTQCCFIEDEGDIVFYKDRRGKPHRILAKQ